MQRVIRDGQFTVDKVDALSAKVALIQKHFPPTVASLYAIPAKAAVTYWNGGPNWVASLRPTLN